ncbi:MAG: oligosaccharide flippase family protein [Rhodospirillales bacterium]|nr:oligosaccharide flippase family protein [Rhodospirillales bacterium]
MLGVLWMLSSAVAQALLQIVVLAVLARMVSPEAFGVAAAALVIVRVSEGLFTLGVDSAVIQRMELNDRHVAAAFTFYVITGLAALVLLQALAPWLAGLMRMAELTPALRLLAVAIPILHASEVGASLMRRNLRFRQVASVSLLSYGVGYGMVGVFLASQGMGAMALAGAYVVEVTVRSVAIIVLQPHSKTLCLDFPALRQLLAFGVGIFGYRLASQIATQADNLIVGRLLGAEALGLYSRACHLRSRPRFFWGKAYRASCFRRCRGFRTTPAGSPWPTGAPSRRSFWSPFPPAPPRQSWRPSSSRCCSVNNGMRWSHRYGSSPSASSFA